MPTAHVPVYVEANTHGSLPTYVDYFGVGKNRGKGSIRLPTNVTNIGEAFRPRLGTEVVTQFNERWGAFNGTGAGCTEGPVLHLSEWKNPLNRVTEAEYVGTWDAVASINNSQGRISWPGHTLGEAVVAASSGTDIFAFPVTYTGTTTIAKPLTIETAHGCALFK